MFSALLFFLPTVISTGLLMYFFAILDTSLGMVAENSQVLFSDGVVPRIASRSSLNPMLSISSASSRITYATFSSFTIFLLIRSSNLPGVATMICVPFFIWFLWFSMLAPP